MNESFWKREPREPWSDWRTYSLLLPLICSAVAYTIYGIFTYAFDDIRVIAPFVQSWMVIVAALFVAVGAELGTPFTGIEVYRKQQRSQADAWDWSALIVSFAATLIGVMVALTVRSRTETGMSDVILTYGPVVVGIVVAADGYGGIVELGKLIGSYEDRREQWDVEKHEHEQIPVSNEPDASADILAQLAVTVEGLSVTVIGLSKDMKRLSWDVAKLSDFRKVRERTNGDTLNRDTLAELLAKDEKRLPSDRTVDRWLREVN